MLPYEKSFHSLRHVEQLIRGLIRLQRHHGASCAGAKRSISCLLPNSCEVQADGEENGGGSGEVQGAAGRSSLGPGGRLCRRVGVGVAADLLGGVGVAHVGGLVGAAELAVAKVLAAGVGDAGELLELLEVALLAAVDPVAAPTVGA